LPADSEIIFFESAVAFTDFKKGCIAVCGRSEDDGKN
jgi:hypothetical protein